MAAADDQLKSAGRALEIQRKTLAVQKMKREADAAAGKLVSREEVVEAHVAILQAARRRFLEEAPPAIAAGFPKKQQPRIEAAAGEVLSKLCDALAADLAAAEPQP